MKSNKLTLLTLVLIALLLLQAASNGTQKEIQKIKTPAVIICSPSFDTAQLNKPGAPLLNGLGNLQFAITTQSPLAQKYFNQALILLFGFNHSEAGRSFKQMARLDSTCAMAYWGMGMVLGPNYNAGLNPAVLTQINEAMHKAAQYAAKASPKEQALINALIKRFPQIEVTDMAPFNEAYAQGMKKAYEQFPGDMHIAALYADALMNEHPWDLWNKDGTPKPWMPPIQQLLEKLLAAAPDHPGVNHLYIHAMEASRVPSKALPSADRLRDMIPVAGHLTHMPSHIYIRTGHYHKGVIANEKATEADSTYIAQCQAQGFYPMLLYPHNIHFLAACAFFEGSSKKAIDAAWMVSRKADKQYLKELITLQHYYAIPFYVMVHFGKWNDIVSLPEPGDSLKYPTAIWHYARGMAWVNKGNLQQAKQELEMVKQFTTDKQLQTQRIWDMNSAMDVINIAAYTLESEIAFFEKQYDKATGLLKKAVNIEDNLVYQEPPDWFFSVRHSLGRVLTEAHQYTEAEKIYREDLATYPENGWALIGLYNTLQAQKKTAEAAAVKKRFDAAWQWADTKITTSRVN